MLFELRMYRIQPGQRDAYVKWFEEEALPYLISKGIVVVGSFINEQEEDQFVWIRRYDSEEERVRINDNMSQSEHWQETLLPRIKEFMVPNQMQVIRLLPTPKSVIR